MKTHEYMEEMGQTGAGIEREADINMDTPNAFTTKWGKLLLNHDSSLLWVSGSEHISVWLPVERDN